MRNRQTFKLIVLALSQGCFASAIYAQGHCTLQNISGTLAFNVKGGSSLVSGPSEFPLHRNAAIAPLAIVGVMTIRPDGTGDGQWWQIVGTLNAGLNPIPFQLRITQLGDDCTGTIEYTYTPPYAQQPVTNKDRFVILDNGREVRSASMAGGLPTATWATTGRRITDGPMVLCDQHMLEGEYLTRCESLGLPGLSGSPLFSATTLLRVQMAASGDYTGISYAKLGPAYGEAPVAGKFTLERDCTAGFTLTSPAFPGLTMVGKAVFFDQSNGAYMLPIATLGPGADQSHPVPYALCEVTRLKR